MLERFLERINVIEYCLPITGADFRLNQKMSILLPEHLFQKPIIYQPVFHNQYAFTVLNERKIAPNDYCQGIHFMKLFEYLKCDDYAFRTALYYVIMKKIPQKLEDDLANGTSKNYRSNKGQYVK